PDEPEARARFDALVAEGVAPHDAGVVARAPDLAHWLDRAVEAGAAPRLAAGWLVNELPRVREGRALDELPFGPDALAALLDLVRREAVSPRGAREVLQVLGEEGGDPAELVERLGLALERDEAALAEHVDAVLEAHADRVEAYRAGKRGLLGFFVGEVMKRTGGRADPRAVQTLLRARLD
ncbi:MAG: hypothetical protein D6701_13545, partial [Gemmatimonadetes bacterium]